jgi:hypothetical protein
MEINPAIESSDENSMQLTYNLGNLIIKAMDTFYKKFPGQTPEVEVSFDEALFFTIKISIVPEAGNV